MAKFPEYGKMNPRDFSLKGVRNMYARAQRGFEDSEKPAPGGSRTFNPETLNIKQGLLGQETFDQTHPAYQKPQGREDRPDSRYDNDVRDGWTRGSGEDATTMPFFDHRGKDGMPKKWRNT